MDRSSIRFPARANLSVYQYFCVIPNYFLHFLCMKCCFVWHKSGLLRECFCNHLHKSISTYLHKNYDCFVLWMLTTPVFVICISSKLSTYLFTILNQIKTDVWQFFLSLYNNLKKITILIFRYQWICMK